MSCKVWVWNYQGSKSAFGHAALEVYGGDPTGTYYISWWPKCLPNGTEAGLSAKKTEFFGMCEPMRSRTMATDVSSETGNRPDRHVLLDGLDETKIKAFWDDLTSNPQARWSATTTNCAAAVLAALYAGGSKQYFSFFDQLEFDVFKTNWLAWTPDSVCEYAVQLQKNLRNAGKMP